MTARRLQPWPAILLLVLAAPACASLPVARAEDPCPSLEAKDFARILTDYDLTLASVAPVRTPAGTVHSFGTTNFDRHQLFINRGYIAPIRRLALIHELLHVRRSELGLGGGQQQDEELVRECAPVAYRRIFGGDLDLPEAFRAGH